MRIERFHNVIFPLLITMFLPPLVIIPLIGNLIIDGMIYYLFLNRSRWMPPRKQLVLTIISAWVLGFLADVAGAALLVAAAELLPLNIDLVRVWSSPSNIIIFLVTIILVGLMIYLLNRLLLKTIHAPRPTAGLVALAMGIITAPWFFLIPTHWLQAFMR